jgi:hypothetical protein
MPCQNRKANKKFVVDWCTGKKVCKRFRCVEVVTKQMYLFSPVYEVEVVG